MAWSDFAGSGPGGAWIVGDRFGNNQVEAIRQNFVMLKGTRLSGSGSPEGTVTGTIGELYRRTDGGPGTTLYIKESGAGNTGWRAVGVPPPAPLLAMATVTLTDAQIKALPTTGVPVVAAPAAGYRVKLISGTISLNSVAGAYTNFNADGLLGFFIGTIRLSAKIYNDTGGTLASTSLTDFLGAAHQRIADLGMVLDPDVSILGGPTDLGAKSLDVKADNKTSGAFTGGNAANSMKVFAYYVLEQL